MFGVRIRLFSGLIALAAMTPSARAQWLDPCNTCAQPVAVNPCVPCMQAVPQTVFRDVPVTEYRAVKKTVQRPVVRTVMEDRPVTVYRQVNETRTADVQSVAYQTVTECQPQCVNRSYWRTMMQPVPKMSSCQYDSRPGLLGQLNRMGYSTRMAFTPDYIPRREFVPNVQTVNVPIQRTVAVPTTRQVSYNVSHLVPEQTTQQVAVSKIEYVDQEVTAYEPFTTTRRMAVGTTYTYAYLGGIGGTTATAQGPTPADGNRSAEGPHGEIKPMSFPPTERKSAEPTPVNVEGPVASLPVPSTSPVVRTVGWRPARAAAAAPTPAPTEVSAF